MRLARSFAALGALASLGVHCTREAPSVAREAGSSARSEEPAATPFIATPEAEAISCDGAVCKVQVITPRVKAALEALPNRAELTIQFREPTTNDDLASLVNAPWATKVSIARCREITDLAPLAHLEALRELDASSVERLTNVRALAWLAEVEKLNLYMTKVDDLTPLRDMKKLAWLDLYATPVTDVTPLAGLTSLTYLDLYRVSAQDLSPLAGLVNLEELWLQFSPLTDASLFVGMKHMKSLQLSYSSALADISALGALTEIESLALAETKVADLAPLASMARLQVLSVAGCKNVRSLSPLTTLSALRSVDVRGTAVSDPSPLRASAASLVSLQLAKGTPAARYAALARANPKLAIDVAR